MKKILSLFVFVFLVSISHAFAQSAASSTATGQSVVVTESDRSVIHTSSGGTITKAGKNEPSVYTPPATGENANNTGSSSAPAASSVKEQPAVVDPKKRN